MKRKTLAGMMSLALMATIAVPVHAAEDKTTSLNTNVPSTYMLEIPKETTVDFNAQSTNLNGTLKVSGNVLPTQEVVVTATTKALHNQTQQKDLSYKLINTADKREFQSATWDEDTLRDGLTGQGKEIQLSVDISQSDWDTAPAGTYEGGITFTADLQNK